MTHTDWTAVWGVVAKDLEQGGITGEADPLGWVDDAMAAVYGNILMWLAVWYGPSWL